MIPKNNQKTLTIFGILLVVFVLTISTTYAFWTLTRKQTDTNLIIGECLDIELISESEAINLEKSWPITTFEGMQLEGYKFRINNNCNRDIDYRVELERLNEPNNETPMSNEYIKTLFDYGYPTMYSELESVATTDTGVKESRTIGYETVLANASNSHTIRLWIDEASTTSEQNKVFASKIKVVSGQGIEKHYTQDECFTVNESTGTITDYDVACETDVVIPYKIRRNGDNPVIISEIANNAFNGKNLTSVELPKTVTKIGNSSFMGNKEMQKIIFRDGLIEMGAASFYGGISNGDYETRGILNFIKLPETTKKIGPGSFAYNRIEEVIIPDSVITSNLPNSMLTGAFKANEITKIKLGSGVTNIGAGAFSLNRIEEVVIPDAVNFVGSTSFNGNPLKKITLGSGLTTIGQHSFSNEGAILNQTTENHLTRVEIPFNVTKIDDWAFYTMTPGTEIIFLGRSDTTGLTLGMDWNGQATIKFQP